jgi:hypothetical protein
MWDIKLVVLQRVCTGFIWLRLGTLRSVVNRVMNIFVHRTLGISLG